MSRWFRHYAGMMRDDKLVRVAVKAGQPVERVVWVWGAILESAAEINDCGRYDFDEAEAAYFLRTGEDDIRAITAGLMEAGRVDSGIVVKWGDRQFESDRSAARQAAYRERKRSGDGGRNHKQSHQNVTSPSGDDEVTSPSRHGDAPETETETEKENIDRKKNAAPDGAHSGSKAPDAELFDRGKKILGKNAGGLITDLLKAKGKNVALARAALEMASTKENPREYIGAIVRGADPPAGDQYGVDRW